MTFEQQYLAAVEDVLETGEEAPNRTGINTIYKLGLYMKVDMKDGFPLLTTKKVAWKSAFGEMLGFIRGYTNAADFRKLGTNVWNDNANKNTKWLLNPYREGEDDLGRIYGYQWRRWKDNFSDTTIDQLKAVDSNLSRGVDDRREIISSWNPGDMTGMALPPCHALMQFGLRGLDGQIWQSRPGLGRTLDMFLYVRSNDMGLGMPFNVAQYSWLLHLMAKITSHVPGTLHYFAFNYHIYVNHIEALKLQLTHKIRKMPEISIASRCNNLKFLDTTQEPVEDWTKIYGYDPHPSLKMKMAI